MHGGCYLVRPSKNVAPSATPTWAVGTVNSGFPLANVLTLEPDVVTKANENTATLRLTWGGAKTLVGLALINVNFPGVSVALTNNGGMATQNKTAPSPEDNLMINLFFDLTDVAATSATQWNIAVAGSHPVTIGTVVAIEEWTELRVRWDYELLERFPALEHRTSYGKRLQYRIPVRSRVYTGTPFYAEDRNTLRTVRREAQGSITPFVLVPDLNDTDVILGQFSGEFSERTQFTDGLFPDSTARGVVEMPITIEEVSGGVSLL